jgi:Terminase large subunit, T4likevirus-type, N-terminal
MTAPATTSELLGLLPFLTGPEIAELDGLLRETPLRRLRRDPSWAMTAAGMVPDPWQTDLCRSDAPRTLLLCCRQAGKSTAAAALALSTALLSPHSLTLLLSPTLRQSGELFRDKLLPLWRALGCPRQARPPTQLELVLGNGSRVVSLPENEAGVRGFSGVSLLILDEAARVSDDLYLAVRPMLSVSGGRLLALSTPFGQRGWFFEEWQNGGDAWRRVKVTADQCPRISAAFLQEERQKGERYFAQEFLCSFEAAVDAVFDPLLIDRALRNQVVPLW